MTSALLLSATTEIVADDSGFLSDYSKLKPLAGTDTLMYTAPNAYTDFKNYKAVMIDQPEFVIANDSKYKGVKPDDAKAVADALPAQMSDTVTKNGRLYVVDKPGPGVLYIRIAASNIHLKKKSRGLLGYTPAGFVVGSAVSAGQVMQQKIMMNISQRDLATAIHVPYQRVNELVNQKRGVTPSTALRLAKFFGVSAGFWLNLQVRWDLY